MFVSSCDTAIQVSTPLLGVIRERQGSHSSATLDVTLPHVMFSHYMCFRRFRYIFTAGIPGL